MGALQTKADVTRATANKSNTVPQSNPPETFSIGDYVKIAGLIENTELNGQLGIVIPKRNPLEKERISVRVFGTQSIDHDTLSKRDISIRTTNLTRLEKPSRKPQFEITRKILAALYNSGPRARRALNSDSRSIIQAEILTILGDEAKLETALETGERALSTQAELAIFVDTLLLSMQQ